jgi:hypothetical protein
MNVLHGQRIILITPTGGGPIFLAITVHYLYGRGFPEENRPQTGEFQPLEPVVSGQKEEETAALAS